MVVHNMTCGVGIIKKTHSDLLANWLWNYLKYVYEEKKIDFANEINIQRNEYNSEWNKIQQILIISIL